MNILKLINSFNGWRRAWFLISCIWSIPCILFSTILIFHGRFVAAFGSLMVAFIPVLILYVIGRGVAWVREGFKKD